MNATQTHSINGLGYLEEDRPGLFSMSEDTADLHPDNSTQRLQQPRVSSDRYMVFTPESQSIFQRTLSLPGGPCQ